MRSWTFISRIFMSATILAVLANCGGGGSSGGLQTPDATPITSYSGITTSDTTLSQYKTYTFTASAQDPIVGRTIASFTWNFGDGTTATVAAVKNACTVTHCFAAAGDFTGDVKCTDSTGVVGSDVPVLVTIVAAASPVTVTMTNPAPASTPILQVQLGQTIVENYQFNAVTTSGGTLGIANVVFTSGETSTTATVGTIAMDASGNFSIPVTYLAASTTGTRTATATVAITDSLGYITGQLSFPAVTIKTLAGNLAPPVVTMAATPAIPAGANATYQNVAVSFIATASDPDGLAMTYSWTFGDGGSGDVTNATATTALSQTHTFATAGVFPVTFTANNGLTGGVVSATVNLQVFANGMPTLSASWSPVSPYAYGPVAFTAAAVSPSGATLFRLCSAAERESRPRAILCRPAADRPRSQACS